jgi:hypothetical protein
MTTHYSVMRYDVGWAICLRTRAGGFKFGAAECLQDAYAWLFRLGVFEPAPSFFEAAC